MTTKNELLYFPQVKPLDTLAMALETKVLEDLERVEYRLEQSKMIRQGFFSKCEKLFSAYRENFHISIPTTQTATEVFDHEDEDKKTWKAKFVLRGYNPATKRIRTINSRGIIYSGSENINGDLLVCELALWSKLHEVRVHDIATQIAIDALEAIDASVRFAYAM